MFHIDLVLFRERVQLINSGLELKVRFQEKKSFGFQCVIYLMNNAQNSDRLSTNNKKFIWNHPECVTRDPH